MTADRDFKGFNPGSGELIVRADASSGIGAGHLMRCLALAQAFGRRGGRVTFVSSCDSPAIRRELNEEGFRLVEIERPFPDPSDVEKLLDLTLSVGGEDPCGPLIVVDGYHFDSSFHREIREAGAVLLVIDDMAHLPSYHAHILLNQNIHAGELAYSCDPDTLQLLGTPYVLMRQEFMPWAGWRRKTEGRARKVLVTLGGSDPENVTSLVIRALGLTKLHGLETKVVLGPANPHRAEIEKAASAVAIPLELLSAVKEMPQLMAWADLAISAGGSTCWEMAYMGLPNLVAVLAENQRPVAKGLDRAGCSLNLGEGKWIDPDELAKRIESISGDRERRRAMTEKGQGLVDGKGVERVLNAWFDIVLHRREGVS